VRTQPADYGPDDGDVTPPVTISRSLPAWQPINPVDRIRSFRGKLELLVDETGRVSTITVIQGVHVDYDRALLRAVGDWRYKPALRNGVPVRYRLPVDIVLTAKQ